MRIAMINMPVEYYNPMTGGAVATVIREMSLCLIARGHHVSVLTPNDEHPPYETGEVHQVDDTSIGKKGRAVRMLGKVWRTYYRWEYPRYNFYLRSVLRVLRNLSPFDVLVVHNDYMLAYHLRKAVGSKPIIVCYVHNEPKSDFRFLSNSTQATDIFIAISSYIAGRVETVLDVSTARIAVAMNGVNIERFKPGKRFGLMDGACRTLFVGRLNPDKGPDIAIDAIRRLQHDGLSVSLDVAGPVWWHGKNNIDANPFACSIKEQLQAGVGHFLGDVPRDQVPTLMRDYDVLMVPSRWMEPYALVASEGLASGCAVAASRRGGIPEVVGDAGVLFNPEDINDVCTKLRLLVLDRKFLLERKVAARQRAESLTWDMTAAAFERAVQRCRQ